MNINIINLRYKTTNIKIRFVFIYKMLATIVFLNDFFNFTFDFFRFLIVVM